MTIANLFAQHREGRVSKEKFLYEARKDAQLPFISNLTSYDDAIKILKQKGMIKEAVMYGGSDGDYDQNQTDKEETERAYDDGYAAFKAGDKKEAEKLYKKARHLGARLAWDETELPPYDQIKKEREFQGDPRDIEDPYGGHEYVDDEKDIDHNDDYDAARDNGHLGEVSKAKDGFAVDKSYTHFALNRKDNKIATGWDYKGLDSDEIKHWAKIDLKDMELNPANYAILKTASLIRLGINPFNWDNWAKPTVSGEKEDLNEQKDLSLEIDRMNPKIVAKATNFELDKLPVSDMTLDNYFKIQKKVVNKLKKNPKAYDDLFVANSSEMEKTDKTLQMEPVKKDNLKDKPNEMVKAKLKEAILKMLNEEHEIDYAPNNIVKLPEGGEGTIIEVKGGTLTIEMKDKSQRHYQMNVIKHANRPEAMEENPTETEEKDPKDELMEKIAKFLKALKGKKKMDEEDITFVTRTNVQKVKDSLRSDPNMTPTQKTQVNVKPGDVLKK